MGEHTSKILGKIPCTIDTSVLEYVGSGRQGEVYRLNKYSCIKIYYKSKYQRRELANLKKGESHPLFPKVYEWDNNNYIIREYIDGISLLSYFNRGMPLTTDLSMKLIDLWESLERLGFKRLDIRTSHIYVLPKGNLKIIDPTNLMNHRRLYPRKLLSGLQRHGVMEAFLLKAQEIRPDIYKKWT